jgi:hypothetical protein
VTRGRIIVSGRQWTGAWPALGLRVVQYAFLRRNVIRLSLLMCVASSAACVSTYVPPISEVGTATISFEVTGSPLLGFAAYLMKRESPDDHACIIKSQKMAQVAKGNPLLSANNPARIVIPANDAIGFRAMYVPANFMGHGGCSYDLSFSPEPGGYYRVRMDWTSLSCSINLASESGGTWYPVMALIERNRC